jgi:Amt family ammonium transporter
MSSSNGLNVSMEPNVTLEQQLAVLTGNMDAFFVVMMGIVVFLMQVGFAFLEAGAVRCIEI